MSDRFNELDTELIGEAINGNVYTAEVFLLYTNPGKKTDLNDYDDFKKNICKCLTLSKDAGIVECNDSKRWILTELKKIYYTNNYQKKFGSFANFKEKACFINYFAFRTNNFALKKRSNTLKEIDGLYTTQFIKGLVKIILNHNKTIHIMRHSEGI